MSTVTSPTLSGVPFELHMLSGARRYQQWLASSIAPFLGSRILELGSGIGNMSQHLPVRDRLILSDIDPELLKEISGRAPSGSETQLVKISESFSERFRSENLDTIISFNVLEHIEDDAQILRDLLKLLDESSAKGPRRIISIVPAHPFAFGNFDSNFGHYRRYTYVSYKETILRADPNALTKGKLISQYMNLPGLFGWWLFGKILKREKIGAQNMRAFEILCPIIRPIDDFLHKVLKVPFGNSLVAVYELPPR